MCGEIDKWQGETFPDATVSGAAVHLEREAYEVRKTVRHIPSAAAYDCGAEVASDLRYDPIELAEECADVMFMLTQICSLAGIDLAEACAKKLEKNKRRKWKSPDKDGVIEHVEGHHD